jgi:hypothetical protein
MRFTRTASWNKLPQERGKTKAAAGGRGVPNWHVQIAIGGVDWGSEALGRLTEVLDRRFPALAAKCALHSDVLGVALTVEPPTPAEALREALSSISTAFDYGELDPERVSEILNVNMVRFNQENEVVSPGQRLTVGHQGEKLPGGSSAKGF